MKRLKKISLLQTARISAICNAPIGLLHMLVGMFLLSNKPVEDDIIGIFFLFMPVIILVMSFFMTIVLGYFYNLVASKIGGVEFELEDV